MAIYDFETTALNKPEHKKSWRRAGVAAVLAALALVSAAAIAPYPYKTTSPAAPAAMFSWKKAQEEWKKALADVAQIQKTTDQLASQTGPPAGQSMECWLVATIGCGVLGVGISTYAGCYFATVGIDATIEAAGGGPEDPVDDAVVVAFDDTFIPACLAEVAAGAVFTAAICALDIEKRLGISC